MIYNKKNIQWSYEQALSVLIRGPGPSSTPVRSVHHLLYCGNKLTVMFVNTELKERYRTHTTEMWARNDCISVFNEVWSHMINI